MRCSLPTAALVVVLAVLASAGGCATTGERGPPSNANLSATALRDGEALACRDLSVAERESCPFAHPETLALVKPLRREWPLPKDPQYRKIEGVAIVFRSGRALTAERLRRIVACHLAHIDAAGHDRPEVPACPLVPRPATVEVKQTDAGLSVEIRGASSVAMREIWRRAEALEK